MYKRQLHFTDQAEAKILGAGYNKEYLPIDGLDSFRAATVQLLLGADSPAVSEGRVATIQACWRIPLCLAVM